MFLFFSNVVVLLVIAECNVFSYVLFFFSNVVVLLVIAKCNISRGWVMLYFLVMLLYFW